MGALRRRQWCVVTVAAVVAVPLQVGLVAPAAQAEPKISSATLVRNLSIPWDLTWVNGTMLYTQRAGTIYAKRGSAAPVRLSIPMPAIHQGGEGGLMGIVADPKASTKRFYTCQAVTNGGATDDVRVLRWRLVSNTRAVADGTSNVVVKGIEVATNGRHSGCRLRFGTDGYLYVGTGDAAKGANPQNLNALGGKVLRVAWNGAIPQDNPYATRTGNARYVWSYGHRNVQGLAVRPGTNQLWSLEHGTRVDDELNRIVRNGNYGYNPVPGYNEQVPMTDTTLYPNARRAAWRSGNPTIAPSGVTFLTGDAWGRWQGAVAMGVLKDKGIMILSLNAAGQVEKKETWLPSAGRSSRIRTVQQGPDGALYYTTSDGTNDRIIRLKPKAARNMPKYKAGLDVSCVAVSAARTGSTFYVAVRSTGNRIFLKRSTDNARSWGGWVDTGVTSTSAPAIASSASGRMDLLTRNGRGQVVHTWFVDGRRAGQANLGGYVTAAPVAASVGGGTLDVFVRGRAPYGAARKHFDGTRWSAWTPLGGVFTSALGASADATTKRITLSGRGSGGSGYERVVTPTSNGSGWVRTQDRIWSARALGDTYGSAAGRVGVTSGSDLNATVDRSALTQGITALYTSAPDVVTRADGTWVMFGRSSSGSLYLYDARPGAYKNVNLGGVVR